MDEFCKEAEIAARILDAMHEQQIPVKTGVMSLLLLVCSQFITSGIDKESLLKLCSTLYDSLEAKHNSEEFKSFLKDQNLK